MKMKNVFYALLLMTISQSVFATMFTVINKTSDSIEVDPVWSGNTRGFLSLDRGQGKSFDSGLHHLKTIRWRYPNGWCFYADLENQNIGRARLGVKINILGGGQCSVDLGGGEGMPIRGIRCNQ